MAQYTKKAIAESFIALLNERPFDKISVVDIAERCEINRNTFYYYYADVFALVDEVFHIETQKIMEKNLDCGSWQEAFMQVTDFARANRQAVYHLYKSANRDRLEEYLYSVMLMGITSFVKSQAEGLLVSDGDINALSTFYTSALLGLILKWLREGMQDDMDAYVVSLGRLLDGNIRLTFERCARAGLNPLN